MQLLTDFLHQETEIEKQQKKTGSFVPDFSEMKTQAPHLTNDLFFHNRDIYISKHNRYAPYPLHSHQFLELNYIYSGHCQQIINGQTYTLYQGDILLMDVGSKHQIECLEEEDIVINLLFKDNNISLQSLEEMQGNNSLLYHLLLSRHSHLEISQNFIILRSEEIPKVPQLLHRMIEEYFFQKDFSQEILKHSLSILLYELARSLPTAQKKLLQTRQDPFLQVLELIDRDYRDLTLAKAADQLKFNKNYLSNLVKEKSGQTFTELVHQKRLMSAKLLIQSTDFSIETICQTVGFSNKTNFYKQFALMYGMKPSEMRRKS